MFTTKRGEHADLRLFGQKRRPNDMSLVSKGQMGNTAPASRDTEPQYTSQQASISAVLTYIQMKEQEKKYQMSCQEEKKSWSENRRLQ